MKYTVDFSKGIRYGLNEGCLIKGFFPAIFVPLIVDTQDDDPLEYDETWVCIYFSVPLASIFHSSRIGYFDGDLKIYVDDFLHCYRKSDISVDGKTHERWIKEYYELSENEQLDIYSWIMYGKCYKELDTESEHSDEDIPEGCIDIIKELTVPMVMHDTGKVSDEELLKYKEVHENVEEIDIY